MNKKKLNRLNQKWHSSNMYAGSFYAEMQRDGFVFMSRGTLDDQVESLSSIIRCIEKSTEGMMDYLFSVDELAGEITYRQDSEGHAIYVCNKPDEFEAYALGCNEDMRLMLANILTYISKKCNISTHEITFRIFVNILAPPGHSLTVRDLLNTLSEKEDSSCIH